MFAYRMLMAMMFVDNIIRILPKLIGIAAYLFISGIILIAFNEIDALTILKNLKDPIYIYKYLYLYIKWWINNKATLDLKYTIYLLIGGIAPYFLLSITKKTFQFCLKAMKFLSIKFVMFVWKKIRRKKKESNIIPQIINSQPVTQQEILKKEIMEEIGKIVDFIIKKNNK